MIADQRQGNDGVTTSTFLWLRHVLIIKKSGVNNANAYLTLVIMLGHRCSTPDLVAQTHEFRLRVRRRRPSRHGFASTRRNCKLSQSDACLCSPNTTLQVSVYYLGTLVGCLVGGWVGDKIGRVRTIAFGAGWAIFGAALQCSAQNHIWMIFARLINGWGTGVLVSSFHRRLKRFGIC